MVVSLSELNSRNKDFWAVQSMLMLERLADPVLGPAAMRALASEHDRGVPVRSRLTLELALEQAGLLRENLARVETACEHETAAGQAAEPPPQRVANISEIRRAASVLGAQN